MPHATIAARIAALGSTMSLYQNSPINAAAGRSNRAGEPCAAVELPA